MEASPFNPAICDQEVMTTDRKKRWAVCLCLIKHDFDPEQTIHCDPCHPSLLDPPFPQCNAHDHHHDVATCPHSFPPLLCIVSRPHNRIDWYSQCGGGMRSSQELMMMMMSSRILSMDQGGSQTKLPGNLLFLEPCQVLAMSLGQGRGQT